MNRLSTLIIAVLLVALLVSAIKAQGQAFTWGEFNQKYVESPSFSSFSINNDLQPEIGMVGYRTKSPVPPYNIRTAADAFFAMPDGFRLSELPEFIVDREPLEAKLEGQFLSYLVVRVRFWQREEQRFILLSEAVLKKGERKLGEIRPIWADDSSSMVALHRWVDGLGNSKRLRFRFVAGWQNLCLPPTNECRDFFVFGVEPSSQRP